MKLKLTYLFLLGLLLCKGYHPSFAGTQGISHNNSSVRIFQKDDLNLFSPDQQSNSLFQYSLFNENDEDNNCTSSRKKVVVSRFFSALNDISSSDRLFNSLKKNPPFYKHFCYLSHYKYIFQRALRI